MRFFLAPPLALSPVFSFFVVPFRRSNLGFFGAPLQTPAPEKQQVLTDFSLISGPGPASPEDGEDLEARSASECMDHRERNDSKSRLAIPNSFLHDFGHRRILGLPIFGRGFCRFHFDRELSFQIPTDCYLMFCQSR